MKIKKILIVFLLLILLGSSVGIYLFKEGLGTTKYDDNIAFSIPKGTYPKAVFSLLEEAGIVKNGDFAYYYSRIKNIGDFKAGDYEIPERLTLDELIAYLSDSNNALTDTYQITLYEDDNLEMMAQRISNKSKLDYETIIEYWSDIENVTRYIEEYEVLTEDILNEEIRYPLEGYLSPNTYEFFAAASIEDITKKLLDQSEKIYHDNIEGFNKSKYSIHQVFTLASIIQYESGNPVDMPAVAGVFNNRIAIDMPLQSTVTACYANSYSKEECQLYGDLFESTEVNHRYNTYVYYGLPPGPILCPGEQAILATLYPEENDYYYFIGAKCGELNGESMAGKTVFATDLAQHETNIGEYLSSCQ